MPLYIRDEAVNSLAEEVARLANINKTEAVRLALEHEREQLSSKPRLSDRIRKLQQRAAELGLKPDGYDDKPLMDDLSGGL